MPPVVETTSDAGRALTLQACPVHPNPAIMKEDILAQIFLILSRYDTNRDSGCFGFLPAADGQRRWDWIKVTEVCRSWQTVALGTPELWSYISTQTICNPVRLKRFLLLSKCSGLTVHFQLLSGDEDDNINNLKTVLKEMSRIQHLSITLLPGLLDYAELFKLLDQPAPRAVSIQLSIHDNTKPHFLLPTNSPGILQRVSLYSINLSSNLPRFSGLTSLSLVKCNNVFLQEVLAVLERSPRLSYLFISFCNIQKSLITESVHLPHLSRLFLHSANYSEVYSLLRSLDAPNLLQWIVCCKEKLLLKDVGKLNLLSKLLGNENEGVCLSISIEPSACVQMETFRKSSMTLKETQLELSFDQEALEAGFIQIVKTLSAQLARAEQLTVEDPLDSVTVDAWRTALRACVRANIVQAPIECDVNANRSMSWNHVQALGLCSSSSIQTGEHQESASEKLCPKLDCLIIRYYGGESHLDGFLPVLEEVLRTRAEYGHGAAVRRLSIHPYRDILDNGRSRGISRWVEELDWRCNTEDHIR